MIEPIQTALDIFRVSDREALRRHYERVLDRARLVERQGPAVKAYVSDNRWVADCPDCNGGIGVLPGETHAVCLGCGLRCSIEMPKDLHVAEVMLLARPPEHRHWRTHEGESVEALARENVQQIAVG